MKISIVNIVFFIFLAFIYLRCMNHHNTVLEPETAIQSSIPEDNQLKILSWNIKMFPAPYGWLFKPYKRAANIIQVLKESDGYDIIFFQEAFSGSIRRKIYAELQNIYPHEVEPNDQTAFYKINSGLWVISRLPITLNNHISFTNFQESDKLASKGAKLFSVIKYNQEFHLINTHLTSFPIPKHHPFTRNSWTTRKKFHFDSLLSTNAIGAETSMPSPLAKLSHSHRGALHRVTTLT